jgi:hypothetical protein
MPSHNSNYPRHDSIPSFLNETGLHCNVFTKAVYNQSSNWLLVGQHIATPLIFIPSAWKKTGKRNFNRVCGTTQNKKFEDIEHSSCITQATENSVKGNMNKHVSKQKNRDI